MCDAAGGMVPITCMPAPKEEQRDRAVGRGSRSEAVHRARKFERECFDPESKVFVDDRQEIFERYPRPEPFNLARKEGAELETINQEHAAKIVQARVKLAQQLQTRFHSEKSEMEMQEAVEGGCIQTNGSNPPKYSRRRWQDEASSDTRSGNSDMESQRNQRRNAESEIRGTNQRDDSAESVGAPCVRQPAKAAKPRQDKTRSHAAALLAEEERARRKRLVDVQPKISRLSFPFSPRGKKQEAESREAECRGKGGIAFVIGDEAEYQASSEHFRRPVAGEFSVPASRRVQPRKLKSLTGTSENQGITGHLILVFRETGFEWRICRIAHFECYAHFHSRRSSSSCVHGLNAICFSP